MVGRVSVVINVLYHHSANITIPPTSPFRQHHHSANITIPPASPKPAQLIVQSLHIHIITFYEVLYQESLDSSILSPVIALHIAFTAR
jgi:hypothetical protein